MTRSFRRRFGLAAVAALGAVAASGCRHPASPPADAGMDLVADDGSFPIALAIAITGCRSYTVDSVGGHCAGSAPLALALSPVSSPDFVRFTWSFGDGTPDVQDRAPNHAYPLPGAYTIVLTGVLGQGGTVQASASIDVEALSVGAPCDIDAQCGAGLDCGCAPGAGCAAAFARGLCTTSCAGALCPAGGVCASIALPRQPADGSSAAAASCLADCEIVGCPAGLTCESLVGAGSATGGWVRGCVPIGALADVGAPCRNANGDLDGDACATTVCADLGALGACSAPCDAGQPCPPGSTCAELADGRRLCLASCSASGVCVRDPLLICSAPGASAGGFDADAGAGVTYCAPKACATDADCGAVGRCGPGKNCVRL